MWGRPIWIYYWDLSTPVPVNKRPPYLNCIFGFNFVLFIITSIFKMALSDMLDLSVIIADRPWSVNVGLRFVLKFSLGVIYSFWNIAILEFGVLAWNCLFAVLGVNTKLNVKLTPKLTPNVTRLMWSSLASKRMLGRVSTSSVDAVGRGAMSAVGPS